MLKQYLNAVIIMSQDGHSQQLAKGKFVHFQSSEQNANGDVRLLRYDILLVFYEDFRSRQNHCPVLKFSRTIITNNKVNKHNITGHLYSSKKDKMKPEYRMLACHRCIGEQPFTALICSTSYMITKHQTLCSSKEATVGQYGRFLTTSVSRMPPFVT